jgi:hypothetical protein
MPFFWGFCIWKGSLLANTRVFFFSFFPRNRQHQRTDQVLDNFSRSKRTTQHARTNRKPPNDGEKDIITRAYHGVHV